MIEWFAMISLAGAALVAPGWLWARRHGPQALWPLFLPTLGVVFWFFLVMLHIGPQSLSNLIEAPGVMVGAVIAAYLKFFVLDRRLESEKGKEAGSLLVFLLVAAVAIAFRAFTPLLPE